VFPDADSSAGFVGPHPVRVIVSINRIREKATDRFIAKINYKGELDSLPAFLLRRRKLPAEIYFTWRFSSTVGASQQERESKNLALFSKRGFCENNNFIFVQ